jgi:hypothetical protein
VANKKWYRHPAIATGILINLFVLLLALAWSGDPARLDRLLVEDGIVEWMQFLCFSALAGLLGFAFFERLSARQRHGESGVLPLLTLSGLSLLCALAALEEISWFQRILDVQSSEFFLQNNRQGETNLHNLAVGDGSLHKNVLLKLIFITGIIHNLILPLVARSRPGVQDWVEKMGLYLPPLSASLPYLVLVALSHLLIEHPRKGELGETFGAVHYMATVFGAYYAGVAYRRAPLFENPSDLARLSKLFALWMLFLLMTGWLLSAGADAVIR